MEKRLEINERAMGVLLRVMKEEIPFINNIEFSIRENPFYDDIITAYVDINLSDMRDSFPTNVKIDYEYLEDADYQIINPFHVFDNYREHDLSINNLVKALSRSIGVDVYEIIYYIKD
jgi:hypothetical protein